MADWRDIPDASIEPNAPARSIDAFAFRDNPIAITEGASGAPRIQTAAIADNAVTAAKINVLFNTQFNSIADNTILLRVTDPTVPFLSGVGSSANNRVISFGVMQTGQVRLRGLFRRDAGSGSTTRVSTLVNGAIQQTTTTGSTQVEFIHTVSVTRGDVVDLRFGHTGGTASDRTRIQNVQLRGNNHIGLLVHDWPAYNYETPLVP